MDEHISVGRSPASATDNSLLNEVLSAEGLSSGRSHTEPVSAQAPRSTDGTGFVSSAADSKLELGLQYQTFSVLWSIAALFVVWQRLDAVVQDPIHWLTNGGIVGAAIIGLICSGWVWPVVLIGVLHALHAVLLSPHASSADWLFAFFGATIFASYASSVIVTRSHRISGISIYRSFVPPMRIMLLLCLLAIGVARLNWGFLDVGTSPVVTQLNYLRGEPVHAWLGLFSISMLIVVDLFLAAALLVPSLRRFAVGVGSCYFCWQAWMGFGEASSMLPALLVGMYLFTSTESPTRFLSSLQRWVPLPAFRSHGLGIVVIVVTLIATAIWAQQRTAEQVVWLTYDRFIGMCFFVLLCFWLTLLLTNLIDYRPKLTWISLAPRNVVHYGLLAVFIVFAASPYLGLGSLGRLTQASGFVSLGEQNNHLLVPQASLTRFDDELVEIETSNDPYLAALAEHGMQITWFDLVNHLYPRPDTSLTFVRGSDRYNVERSGDIDVFSAPNPWIARKFLGYQPIPKAWLGQLLSSRISPALASKN